MDLFLKFSINAARRLPKLPPEHICSQLHGHTFLIEIHVRGEVDPKTGWVLDFSDIDAPAKQIKDALDHRYLNDVPGLSNPTSESLAVWIWEKMGPCVADLHKIVVMEGTDRGCTYFGPNPR
ncbi:MAG: 6-carboxytetrahydropterin synthase QueD [Proteobacteria bacterium]|nr:6-carboxytetrahydropterin synthase QueD [Pseudomonadota bacterium]